MPRIHSLGLALATSLTIAAAAAPAPALAAPPEFKPAKGTLLLKSGASQLEAVDGILPPCSSDKGTGSITGAKTATIKLIFEGCSTLGDLEACNSKGDPPREITIEANADLTTSGTEAVLLFLTSPKETILECDGNTFTLLGASEGAKNNGLICPVTPIGKKVKTSEHYTATCARTSHGVNKFTKAVPPGGGTEATYILEIKEGTGSYVQASEETTEESTNSLESEIT